MKILFRTMLIAAALVVVLSGCGRKGDLEHPPDGKASFPRSYPSR